MNEIQEKCFGILQEIDRVCKCAGLTYYMYSGTLLGAVRHKGFIPWDDDIDLVMMRDQYEKFPDACRKYLNHDKFVLQTIYSDPFASNGWMKLHDKNTAFISGIRREGAMEGINVDIFPVDNVPDSNFVMRFRAKIINWVNFIYQYRFLSHKRNASFKMRVFQSVISLIPPWNEQHFKEAYDRYIQRYNKYPTKRVVYFSNAKYMLKVVPRSCFDYAVNLPFEKGSFPAPVDWRKVLETRYGADYMTPPPEAQRISQHGAKKIDLTHSWMDFINDDKR